MRSLENTTVGSRTCTVEGLGSNYCIQYAWYAVAGLDVQVLRGEKIGFMFVRHSSGDMQLQKPFTFASVGNIGVVTAAPLHHMGVVRKQILPAYNTIDTMNTITVRLLR